MGRTVAAMVLGILLGVAGTLSAVMLTGGWYEYHFINPGENPRILVNEHGWELTLQTEQSWHFRRPRFRLR